MRSPLPFIFLFLASFYLPLSGQHTSDNIVTRLTISGDVSREIIPVRGMENAIELCGMEVGETYILEVAQPGPFHPRIGAAPGGKQTEELIWVAETTCADFRISLDDAGFLSGQPVFLAIAKQKESSFLSELPNLSVSGNNAAYLVQNVLIGGDCFDVTNVQLNGNSNGIGTFSNGLSSIGLDNGVIISTGNINNAPGPNDQTNASTNFPGTSSDPDLQQLAGNTPVRERVMIQFDFQPTSDTVTFKYAFASEEYCDYVNAGYNDVFGFFISGPGISGPFSNNGVNLATLPGGGPVTIDNVNWSTNSQYYVDNVPVGQAQQGNGCTTAELNNPAYAPNDIQFDGFTVVLTSTAVVQPCGMYHIKLAVGDVGDGIFDSAVFLEANSFDAGGQARGEAFSATTGTNVVYEPCADGVINFEQIGGDPNLPFVVHFSVDPASTATAGVDYATLPDSIVIPAGATTFSLPVTVFSDNIAEGPESIIILLSNPCSCQAGMIELIIEDPPPLDASLSPQTFCGPPGSITLSPSVSGGVPGSGGYTYSWSTGGTGSSISVNPTSTETYVVTVTDGCNGQDTASTTITVLDVPTASIDGNFEICKSGNVQPVDIPVNFTGTPPWTFVYVLDGVPQPPITTTDNPYIITLNQPGTVTLQSVSDPDGICPGTVSGTVSVTEIEITPSPIVTDVNCTGGADGTIEITVNGGTSPYTYVWSNGGSGPVLTDLPAGTYDVTVTDMNGCEGTTSATVNEPPPPPPFNAFPDDQTICGLNPTTLTPSVSGGVNPYTYSWDDGSNGSSITVSPGGAGIITHTVTITDDCGNVAITTVSAEFFEQPTASINGTFEICAQGNVQPVSISINFTGNPPWEFVYSIDGVPQPPVTTTDNPFILTTTQPGNYALVSVGIPGENCPGTVSGQASITEIVISPNASATDESCLGQGNGTVTASGGGGTAPYTFNWDNGASGPTQTGLPAGTYTVTVSDANGCTEQTSATVGSPPLLTASASSPTPANCYNPNGGSVSVTGGGGTPGYTYIWSNGSTSPNPTNLPPGTYDVTITDANGCTATASATVNDDTTPPLAVANAVGQLDCINQTITISGIGSSTGAGINYQWSGPGIVSGGNSLNPIVNQVGTYTLVVTNSVNGCTAEATASVTGDQTPPVAVATGGNLDCNNPIIQIDGTGSSTGGNITFTWSGPGIIGGANTLTPTVNQGGTYTLTVVNNDNGCTAEAFAVVSSNIDLPTAVAQADPLTCTVTQITIDGNGSTTGPNISYDWTTAGGNIISGGNTLFPVVDAPGTYILTVNNSQTGCSSQTQVTIPLNNTPPVASATTPIPLTCSNSTTEIFPFGTSTGPNITYQWSGPGLVSSPNVYQPTVNAPGTYTLVVTDTDNGCTAQTQVEVPADMEPPEAVALSGGDLNCYVPEVTLDGSGSTSGNYISYQWVTTTGNFVSGQNTPFPVVDAPGNYILIVINNENGCTASASVDVAQDIDAPDADAGPTQLLTCLVTEATLDGTGTPIFGNITFEWAGPGIISGANTLTPTVNQTGIYTLTVTDLNNGCSTTDEVEVALDSDYPFADAGPPQVLDCGNPTVVLDGLNSSTGSNYSYEWSTTDGNILSGVYSLTPEVDQPGTYSLTVTNTINGCQENAAVTVTDNFDLPEIDIDSPEIIDCANPLVTIFAGNSSSNGNFSYQWATTDGNIVEGENTLFPVVDEAGFYTLTILNLDNECTATQGVMVDEDLNYPVANIAPPATLNCTVGNVTLDASNSSSGGNLFYDWTTTDGHILSGQNTLQPVVDSAGTYLLTIVNLQNSCSTTESVTVTHDLSTPTADAGDPDMLNCSVQSLTLNGQAGGLGNLQYEWQSADGHISNGQNTLSPVVDAPGTYTLTVTNLDNNCTAASSVHIIEDVAYPVANPGPAQTLNCYNPTLQLSGQNSSTGPQMVYSWTTTDGHFISGQNTPTPEIDQPGTYTFMVLNTQNTCADTAEVVIDENKEIPLAAVADAPVMGCGVDSIKLKGSATSGNPILNYAWTTTGGHILSGQNTLKPVVDAPGIYTLTVLDPFNGCSSTASVEIIQNTETPVVSMGPGGEINCSNTELTLSATASGQTGNFMIQWTTDDGNIVSGENTLTPVVDAGGLYELLVLDTTNNCSASATIAIDEDANIPEATILPSGTLNCQATQVTLDAGASAQGPGITFSWTSPNGHFLNGQNTLSPQIDAPGTYTLTIFDTNNNCQSTETVTIPLDTLAPQVELTGGLLTCADTAVTIAAETTTPPDNWLVSWTSPDGAIDAGANTLTPVVSTPGTYILTTTNPENHCTAESVVEVTQYVEYPTASLLPPDTLTCQRTQIPIDATASSSGQIFDYQWVTTDGQIISGENTLMPVVDAPGLYALTITNVVNGCSTEIQTTVAQDVELPEAVAFTFDTLTCEKQELSLLATGTSLGSEFVYQWSTTDGHIVSGENSLSPVVNAPGTYELLVQNSLTQCASTAVVEVPQDIVPPVAAAGKSPLLTCAVKEVTLDGTASSAESVMIYEWTTTDGNILSGENTLTPVVNEPGFYTLQITNTNNGCTSLDQVEVLQDIALPEVAIAPADILTCAVKEVTLDGTASQAGADFAYTWTTANGHILSGENSLTPVVDQVGEYVLEITNVQTGCQDTAQILVTEDLTPPDADAGPTNELNCDVPTLELNGLNSSQGPEYVYAWQTTDGHIVAGAGTLVPVIDAPGMYEIIVTNTLNGCTATDQVAITQSIEVPVAQALPPDTLTCAVGEVVIDAGLSSQGTNFEYQWTTADGNIVSGENSLTPVVNQPGTYQLWINNLDNGCENTLDVAVGQDIVPPVAVVSPADNLTCTVKEVALSGENSSVGALYSYEWQTTDGHIAQGANTMNPIVDQPGTYALIVTNTHNGCTSGDAVEVILDDVAPLAAIAPPGTLTCAVSEVTVDASASDAGPQFEYSWTTTDGFIVSGDQSLQPTVNQPGTYNLLITNNINGCTETATAIVNQDIQPPTADAGEPFLLNCVDDVQYLDGTGSQSGPQIAFEWTTTDGAFATATTTPTPGITQPGTYQLIVTNLDNGCTAGDQVIVTRDMPVMSPILQQPPCHNDKGAIALDQVSGGLPPYLYSTDGGNSFYDSPQFTQLDPGQYEIVVQDVNGCEDRQKVDIIQPMEVVVDLNSEVELQLGD
ncbi:MAG: hypothetical protein D6714_03230, partial [Bacteroidetes bacterium]